MADRICEDPGTTAEDLVERICSRAFFKDFVVRSPRFKTPGGKELEAADVLVLFGNQALTIQVKARPHERKESETLDLYWQRLSKKVDAAVKQVPTLTRAFRTGALTEVTTARGLTIPVNPSDYTSVRGLVVLDLPAERGLAEDARTTLYSGVTEHSGVLVHAFLTDEFDAMLEELDTLPDFLEYLEFRERMYLANKVAVWTHNLDLLAFFKLHFELRDAPERPDLRGVVIAEGMWEHYLDEYSEPRRRRRELDEPSFVVDSAIEFLATSFAGYEQECRDEWIRMARELAGFSRMHRRVIGERWDAARLRAVTKGSAFSHVRFQDRPGEVFIVYSGPEVDRTVALEALGNLACASFGVQRVAAFGTAPANEPTTMQMVVMEDVTFDEADAEWLRETATRFFGALGSANCSEFG